METYVAITALVLVAAITPGPNNLVLLQIAARHGVFMALPSIAGVVAGGIVMVLLGVLGLGTWIASSPNLGRGITLAGSVYLLLLAYRLIRAEPRPGPPRSARSNASLPAGAWGLFGFQFLNPKAWVLVLTATSAFQLAPEKTVGVAGLVLIFGLVPTVCLLLWSLLGAAASRLLQNPIAARRMDCLLGSSLAASVALLWI